jgi:aspartyl-tRNA(Asn)/glutamyl-tRNA(Gln) amidotransferase subunit C
VEARTGYTLSSSSDLIRERLERNPGRAWEETAGDGEGERMTAKVTVEDVERVAELAHLELKPEETGPMLDDLNAILDYVAELNELDTAGVAPLAQVTELLDAAGAGGPRGDVVLASLDRATVLKQAPETDQVFFKVPKVIER